jgi:hypothetical protein
MPVTKVPTPSAKSSSGATQIKPGVYVSTTSTSIFTSSKKK